MKYLMILFLAQFHILCLAGEKYLPEQREYIPYEDIGYTQYGTPSLYFTRSYVLTFDDGPHLNYTPQILDLLKQNQIKASFFIVTSRLNSQTLPIAIRTIKDGHILASHHHTHDHNNRVSKKTFKSKLKKSILELLDVYKQANTIPEYLYYRFPYAEYGKSKDYHHMNIIRDVSDELFGDNCIRFVFWDHDSSDWIQDLSSQDVFKNLKAFNEGGDYYTYEIKRINGRKKVVKKLEHNYQTDFGGVILQHDIQKRTIKATKLFLDYVKKQKLKISPLNHTKEYENFSSSCKKAFKAKISNRI